MKALMNIEKEQKEVDPFEELLQQYSDDRSILYHKRVLKAFWDAGRKHEQENQEMPEEAYEEQKKQVA